MKRLVAVVCGFSLFSLTGCGGEKDVDKGLYALSVNGHKITVSEFDKTIEYVRQSMIQMSPQAALQAVTPEMRKNAARQLIANDLMVDAAKKRGFKYDSAAVEAVFTRFQSQFGSKETFVEELKKSGETEEGIRKQMQDGAIIDTLLKTVFASISDADSNAIKAYYDENKSKFSKGARVRVSQIFFAFDSVTSTDEGKKKLLAKAQSALTEVKAGKDFAALANKNSSGPAATDGGDMGWFGASDLRADLSEPLSKLNVGEVSDVVTTGMGYHILKKTATDSSSTANFSEVKDQIAMMLNMRKKNDAINSLVDSLMVKAKIAYYDTSLVPLPKTDAKETK
jgi:parvulin-like peptidyl-prolyl isomerase